MANSSLSIKQIEVSYLEVYQVWIRNDRDRNNAQCTIPIYEILQNLTLSTLLKKDEYQKVYHKITDLDKVVKLFNDYMPGKGEEGFNQVVNYLYENNYIVLANDLVAQMQKCLADCGGLMSDQNQAAAIDVHKTTSSQIPISSPIHVSMKVKILLMVEAQEHLSKFIIHNVDYMADIWSGLIHLPRTWNAFVDVQILEDFKDDKGKPVHEYKEVFGNISEILFKRILIQGDPGCGKSTYANKIALDWANKNEYLREQFDLVFLIPLQTLNMSIEQAIRTLLPQRSISFVEDCYKHHSSKVLLILDGFDELPEDSQFIYSEVMRMLNGKMSQFQFFTIIVTTRRSLVDKVPQRFHARSLLIKGFNEQSMKQFLQKQQVPVPDEQTDSNLILLQNPLFCTIYCSLHFIGVDKSKLSKGILTDKSKQFPSSLDGKDGWIEPLQTVWELAKQNTSLWTYSSVKNIIQHQYIEKEVYRIFDKFCQEVNTTASSQIDRIMDENNPCHGQEEFAFPSFLNQLKCTFAEKLDKEIDEVVDAFNGPTISQTVTTEYREKAKRDLENRVEEKKNVLSQRQKQRRLETNIQELQKKMDALKNYSKEEIEEFFDVFLLECTKNFEKSRKSDITREQENAVDCYKTLCNVVPHHFQQEVIIISFGNPQFYNVSIQMKESYSKNESDNFPLDVKIKQAIANNEDNIALPAWAICYLQIFKKMSKKTIASLYELQDFIYKFLWINCKSNRNDGTAHWAKIIKELCYAVDSKFVNALPSPNSFLKIRNPTSAFLQTGYNVTVTNLYHAFACNMLYFYIAFKNEIDVNEEIRQFREDGIKKKTEFVLRAQENVLSQSQKQRRLETNIQELQKNMDALKDKNFSKEEIEKLFDAYLLQGMKNFEESRKLNDITYEQMNAVERYNALCNVVPHHFQQEFINQSFSNLQFSKISNQMKEAYAKNVSDHFPIDVKIKQALDNEADVEIPAWATNDLRIFKKIAIKTVVALYGLQDFVYKFLWINCTSKCNDSTAHWTKIIKELCYAVDSKFVNALPSPNMLDKLRNPNSAFQQTRYNVTVTNLYHAFACNMLYFYIAFKNEIDVNEEIRQFREDGIKKKTEFIVRAQTAKNVEDAAMEAAQLIFKSSSDHIHEEAVD